jgi:hypothetical protein
LILVVVESKLSFVSTTRSLLAIADSEAAIDSLRVRGLCIQVASGRSAAIESSTSESRVAAGVQGFKFTVVPGY